MKIEPATREDVHFVAAYMRDRDYEEFSAVSWADCRADLAIDLSNRYGRRDDVMCGFYLDKPVCIGALIEARPNVMTMLFFATDLFDKVAFPVTRFIKRELFPRMEEAGVHRFEAVSMVGHDRTHEWLRVLGMSAETKPMKGYGKNGEAFIQFSKVVEKET
jgi:hypothetical protein